MYYNLKSTSVMTMEMMGLMKPNAASVRNWRPTIAPNLHEMPRFRCGLQGVVLSVLVVSISPYDMYKFPESDILEG